MATGVFIEWDMFKDKSTTISEKFIYLEIQNLSMLEHGCIASNAHFADKMGIKKEAVSRLISSLENKGFITSIIKDGSRNFNRTITINKLLSDPKQNVIAPLTKCLETKGNKTINKTIKEGEFENLWIAYGKVGVKGDAKKIYIRPSFKRTPEDIMKAINRYTDFSIGYKKHFATFLNNISNWLEDYEEPQPKQIVSAGTMTSEAQTALANFNARLNA